MICFFVFVFFSGSPTSVVFAPPLPAPFPFDPFFLSFFSCSSSPLPFFAFTT